jgi:HD domain
VRRTRALRRALYLFDLRGGAGAPIYVVLHDNRSTTQRVVRRERSRVASINRPDREVHEDHESCRSAHKGFSLLTDRFDEAFQYAHRLHRTQTRKGTTIPYISHLMVVAALVIEHGGTEDQAIAACCMMP